jgi:ribosomal protein S18 acetylase RimI-like enzyme
MIRKLEKNTLILPRLYDDCVRYAEEISLIEEDYLWPNVSAYVDDNRPTQDFLLLSSPSFYWAGRSLSAYMSAEEVSVVHEFADVLKAMSNLRVHLQTAAENEPHVKKFMRWLPKTYTVRYCRADSRSFRPHYLRTERAIRMTPENIGSLWPSASPSLRKRVKTAPVYACVNESGKLVGTSGVGFLNKKSFVISYTETEPEYRNRGIAKYLTTLASEPLIARGMVGVYSTDITNEPSLAVARALGFAPYCELKCFYN